MKLNADIGEQSDLNQLNTDLDVMPYLDQANIACGGHAGDGITMARTVKLALQYQVQIGAHPSYPDITGFGRRSMRMPKDELVPTIHAQIGALIGVANSMGAVVEYVKPHGALYNDMIKYPSVFDHVLQAIASFYQPLTLMMQATAKSEEHIAFAKAYNVSLFFEAFADRLYLENGQLAPREQDGAVLSKKQAIEQAKLIINEGYVISNSGTKLNLQADSICVHGDSPGALEMTNQIRLLIGSH
ncbi:5-oxoprolinase subunit PxpA [Glaciecola sp. KUL10]|uniref:5-oxoprolinase subunit PxpA n=1 Tax=Glaciecola sp. (strain KUL10) TaxID=2161813 RepID=UPI000D782DCA|nr:5-oxoprolinase subunit PxpA [Glaciecola sp. KUL10]GBL02782.1 hypothetical protein KUL10_00550 [Glaciecola sp. KUL10]